MFIKNSLFLLYVFIIDHIHGFAEISYNLPNLSACAKWNSNGTTLIHNSNGRFSPYALFIDKNNTLFMTNLANHYVYKWLNDGNDLITIEFPYFSRPYGLFVLPTGDIYTSDRGSSRVYKWIEATKTIETVAQFCTICISIFISIHDVIYCSMTVSNQIFTTQIHNKSTLMTVVAGVGFPGSAANMLRQPRGIFVNINLDLYVTDSGNNRIQLFRSNEVNAITIVGASDTIKLNKPTNVVLDANNYIYIVDSGNHRIVASTPCGFRCIVNCGRPGGLYDGLPHPTSMGFDSFGNIYILDPFNNRIQKFLLSNNTYSKYNRDVEIRHRLLF